MESKNRIPFSVGGSSVLMIFVILCLTTFGVLSYVTANADGKISEKNAETVKSYYSAYASVQTRLEQIDSALVRAKNDTKRVVDAGSLTVLEDQAQYVKASGLDAVLHGGMTKEEQYDACYRLFSHILLSKLTEVTVEETEDGETTCAFSEQAGSNRSIQMTVALNPYSSAERYRITGQKTAAAASGSESEGNLELWKGGTN